MPQEQSLGNNTLGQPALAAMWRYRWIVLAATVGGALLATLLGLGLGSTRYDATASLVVTDPRTTTLFSADAAVQLNDDRYVADQIAILQSDVVAQRASELLAAGQPSVSITATDITEDVKINPTASNEIKVRYVATDEHTAVATVNAVIEAYELVRGEAASRDSASAIAQLEQSIANIDIELSELEQQILDFRADPSQDVLAEQYQEALARLTVLQPLIERASGEELDEFRAERADIIVQLEAYARILGIEEENPRLARLRAQETQATARRSILAEERDQLLVDTQLLSGGISLSSPARTAKELSTAVSTLAVLGAFLGLMTGGAGAYWLSERRRRFTERTQPARILRSSLLAEIPVFGEDGVTSNLPIVDHPHTVSAESFRFAATALDLQLRSEQHEAEGTSANTFLVASAGSREGKTVLTANLALAAAREGRRVLVIDADFGNQELSTVLNPNNHGGAGITEVVEAGFNLDDAVVSVGPTGLVDLLERGNRRSAALEFWNLPATRAFLARVGEIYDTVLIDGPPMLHVAYASLQARYVDQVIVVVRHGSSEKMLEDLARRLDLVGTPITGYVYNAAPWRHEMTATEGSLRDLVGARDDDGGPPSADKLAPIGSGDTTSNADTAAAVAPLADTEPEADSGADAEQAPEPAPVAVIEDAPKAEKADDAAIKATSVKKQSAPRQAKPAAKAKTNSRRKTATKSTAAKKTTAVAKTAATPKAKTKTRAAKGRSAEDESRKQQKPSRQRESLEDARKLGRSLRADKRRERGRQR